VAEIAPDADKTSGYAMRGLQARVIDGIGRQIVGGHYAPGDLLPREAELADQFEVSRTSVREGMRVLAAKGLVDIRQKIGTRVRQQEFWNVFDSDILRWHTDVGMGDEIMRNLVEVRQIMEPAAARLAAGRATMDDLRRMDDAIKSMVESARDRQGYAHADVEFHLSVYAATHNVLLRQFGSVVADFMYASFNVQQATAADDEIFLEDAATHAAVYDAINRGNGEKAAEAMLHVVLDGKNALIKALSDQRDGAVAP
jgi:GntR family transcriptional regulator, galactonate operon transcriptional repressor